MTRDELAAVVAQNAGSDYEARLILLAADEYAALMIQRHARTPQPATDLAIREARAAVAEEIAQSIETLLCAPGDHCADRFCPDCIRYGQARDDAATARRIGQAHKHLVRAS